MDKREPVFDQLSRCSAVARFVRALSGPEDRVLDVGSGPERLLTDVLSDRSVTSVDPLIGIEHGAAIRAALDDALVERLGEGSFDWVVSIDTLEHIPEPDRGAFLERLSRLARKGVVVACPVAEGGEAARVDQSVNAVYQIKNGTDYPWLSEHFEHGLPALDSIRAKFGTLGFGTAVRGNGHAPWLAEVLPLVLTLLDTPGARPLVDRISAEFNDTLMALDDTDPVYRKIVVAMRGTDPEPLLPSPAPLGDEQRAQRDSAWEGFRRRVTAWVGAFIGESVTRINPDAERLEQTIRERLGVHSPDADRICDELLGLRELPGVLAQTRAELAQWEQIGAITRGLANWADTIRDRSSTNADAIGSLVDALRDLHGQLDALVADEAGAALPDPPDLVPNETDGSRAALAERIADAAGADPNRARVAAGVEALARVLSEAETHAGHSAALTAHTNTVLERIRARIEQARARIEDDRSLIESLRVKRYQITRAHEDLLARHHALTEQYTQMHARWKARDEALRAKLRAEAQHRQMAEAALAGIHSSRSWRALAPVRRAKGAAGSIRRRARARSGDTLIGAAKSARRALPIPSALSWKFERAFFVLFGPLVKHTAPYSNHTQELARRRSGIAVEPVSAEHATGTETPGLAADWAADQDRRPEAIVQFGVIDWHFRHQRPQHLAEALAARGHRVFYLSPRFVDDPKPGYSAEEIAIPEGVEHGADGYEGRIVQICLHVRKRPLIYTSDLSAAQREQLVSSLSMVLSDFGVGRTIALVQHPGWREPAMALPNARVVYDCMDNHAGFAESSDKTGADEERLFEDSDLTIVTSRWLESFAQRHAPRTELIRNACHPAHFSEPPSELKRPANSEGKKIIGYFGAIAEWFDPEIVRAAAKRFPDSIVWLVGADSAGVGASLADLPNVVMEGEVPYEALPAYVHSMDVCLIPFRINDLTIATNPVKAYETLAAGIPVVSTRLPELLEPEFEGLVSLAGDAQTFCDHVAHALAERDDDPVRDKRRALGRSQTWGARGAALERSLGELVSGTHDPLVSVIVVTWNNLDLTRACLESVLADESYTNLELVVVDNASSDGTHAYLEELAQRDARVKVVLNSTNEGFARANNKGLGVASGDVLVLLNNDTVVTHGWARTAVNHLTRDRSIGLLGVVTNNIGNEARVETTYETTEAMHEEAFLITRARIGSLLELPVVAFFCCAMRRDVYERVGKLDEQYGLGYFEDDDYCQRVRAQGLRVCCAEDVFVHHHLGASFSRVDQKARDELVAKNRAYYESKWGAWVPHKYRDPEDEPLPKIVVRRRSARRAGEPAAR